MTDMDRGDRLAHDLDAAIGAVPGVLRLYPADAAVVRSARQLLGGDQRLASTSVDGSGSALVEVAVDAARPAAEVAEAVAAAARALIGADRPLRVRVSRVVTATAAEPGNDEAPPID